ncbi:MAG: SIMPL domain-containing protein [Sphingobium sp.]
MKARFSALPIILAAAILPAAASAQPPAPPMMAATGPVISFSVTESTDSTPDMATVGTGAQTRALTAKEAMTLNAAAMDKLVAAILKAGVARQDIQTSGINLNPQYDYSDRGGTQTGPKFIGYEASNQLTVKIRKIDAAGDVVDRMVQAGATNVNGPNFGLADDAPVLAKAREKAIRTASARAQFYAAQTGFRSARLLAISETGDIGRPVPMPVMARMDAAAAPATKIEPGQLSSSVTLTFQFVLEK